MHCLEKTSITTNKLGLYCHVPFCAYRCSYCAFYQEPPTRQLIEQYLFGIEKEFSLLGIAQPFDTIYIGGGTPGLLTPKNLEWLCKILTKNNHKVRPVEFSIEFSPATVKKDKLDILANYHCNRITMGVQSFSPKTIQILGRRQTHRQILEAWEIISSCEIGNGGIDLIFGIPGQTLDEWMQDLQRVVDLKPRHISTYNLTFENDTPLGDKLLAKLLDQKSNDDEADFYLQTWDFLRKNGYEHYEISNFCLPSFESVHNSNTWEMQDWIGIGPSACSQYKNRRFANPPSIAQWLQSLERGHLAHISNEVISEQVLGEDSIIFGLRMNRGISILNLQNRYPTIDFSRLNDLFSQLAAEGFLQMANHMVRLTDAGRLIADTIAVKILENTPLPTLAP
ncbi:MAG: coproporphyrinogen III oxidase family protein [Puniceicoccales bacterium]|jgi:oxygen-independent coproporphyrinogen-3 oxidase|nr:coproporphyrinogen III oxidase family protein [Puniceicoccales bacterium]